MEFVNEVISVFWLAAFALTVCCSVRSIAVLENDFFHSRLTIVKEGHVTGAQKRAEDNSIF